MHSLFWSIISLIIGAGCVGWLLWRWLKASDEPWILALRWVITVVVLGFVFVNAARARDEFSKIAALLIGCVGGIVMVLVWRQKFCDYVGDQFASLYTGGHQEVDPAPFYSIANAKRKKGQYAEALAEVRRQLERFPTDFAGWMLVAEIQAEDQKDLAGAQETIDAILSQEGHAAKNIAYALHRQADWQLKLARDPEGARIALERILQLLPSTEQAQVAHQRIAHLGSPELLAERQQPHTVPLPKGEPNVGLRDRPMDLRPVEEDPAVTANNYVRHLEEFPNDNEAREKLALLYAQHYQRMDLATDQLEQLIAAPNQPPKEVTRWLNLLADLQIQFSGDVEQARQTLQRIAALLPKSAAAENAVKRIAFLNLELRQKQQSQVLKLGSYEQNIGLKAGPPKTPGT